MMNSPAAVPHLLIRIIVIIYLLLFLTAVGISCVFLRNTLALQPIPMIGLLKYLLLGLLFMVLSVNAMKSLRLRHHDLHRLAESTRNFKWLFSIAAVIAAAAKMGWFNLTANKPIEVTFIQIAALVALAGFCFWSDGIWKRMDSYASADASDEENTAA